jgi:hypothetical protein
MKTLDEKLPGEITVFDAIRCRPHASDTIHGLPAIETLPPAVRL